jgi:hypothetical protein
MLSFDCLIPHLLLKRQKLKNKVILLRGAKLTDVPE